MIDGIGLPEVTLGTGWAMAAVFAVLVYTGKLVPRRTHDDVVHDRDQWRAESRIKDAQIAEKDKQLGALSDMGHSVETVMSAIQRGPKDGVP